MNEVERWGTLPPEVSEPTTAADIVARTHDVATSQGIKIPGSWSKLIGACAKRLLAEEFPPDMVCAAAYMAVLRGRPELTERIAGDLSLAVTGMRMTPREYEEKVALYAAAHKTTPLASRRQKELERDMKAERGRIGGQA